MSLEPKIIDHPGAGKIQEMTLDQYLSALSPDHLARKQLDEIRGQALKTVDLSTQLLAANEKILELQKRLIGPYSLDPKGLVTFGDALHQAVPSQEASAAAQQLMAYPHQVISTNLAPPPPDTKPAKPEVPKAACPHCGKMVTTSPGGWASHQRNAHKENPAPCPKV